MKSVLNAKFTVIFLELVVICFIFFTKFQNMAVSLSVGTTWDAMGKYIDGFAAISVAMIGLQMIFSLLGVPFDGRFLPLQLTMQVVGLFSYCCFILMKMQYQSISYIWGVFCLIPFGIEIIAVTSQCLKNGKYRLLDHK